MIDEGDGRARAVRSFVRRTGRMTSAQKDALERLAETYGAPGSGRVDLDLLFARTAPRWLEIGFGDGQTLIEMASARPDVDLLGVEVHDPGVGRALLAIEATGLSNVRVMHEDAMVVLEERLAPESLDRVVLYFPDPWPKKRHHKRRIVQPRFAALIASRLRPGGEWHLATDWAPYAEHMVEVLEATPSLVNTLGTGRFSPTPSERAQTRFERRGRRLGHSVFDLVYARRA